MPPSVLQRGFSVLQRRLWLELLPPVRAELGALEAAPKKCSWKNLCVPAVPTWGCTAPLDGGGNVTESLACSQAVLWLRLRTNRSHALQWTCDLESSWLAQRAAKMQNEDTSLMSLLLTSSQLLYSVNIPIRIGPSSPLEQVHLTNFPGARDEWLLLGWGAGPGMRTRLACPAASWTVQYLLPGCHCCLFAGTSCSWAGYPVVITDWKVQADLLGSLKKIHSL